MRSKLDPAERARHTEAYALHRDLPRLRRDDPVFSLQRPGGVDGAVLGVEAFVLRYFGDGGDDRLLVVNLGGDLHLDPAPSRCSPRRPARSGSCSGRARTRSTAAAGPRRSRTGTTTGGSRATPPWPWRPTSRSRSRMPDLVRPMPPFDPARSGIEPLSTREWLVTNGLGGYASGTVCGVADPALSRPADRRPARPAGPDDDAQPAQRAARPARRHRPPRSASRRSPAGRLDTTGTGHLAEFRLEAGLPVWRFEVDGFVAGEAARPAAPAEHRLRDLPPARRATAPSVRLMLRPARPLPRARRAGRRRRTPARTGCTACERPLRARRGARLPAAADDAARPRTRRSRSTPRGRREILYRVEASRGYESTGRPVEPRLLPGRADARRARSR